MFSITDFFSKCDLRIWSRLLKKSVMENFVFCAVSESKKLRNSNLIYYNVNLMTNAFKIIVKYRRKIIAKYRQKSLFIAQQEPSFKVGGLFLLISFPILVILQDFWHVLSKRFGLLLHERIFATALIFLSYNPSLNGQIFSLIDAQVHF